MELMQSDRELMRRMLRWLRDDFQFLCECECRGGIAGAHGKGPLRFEADVVDTVRELAAVIRAGEARVGRAEGGPAWLEAVIDARRDIVAEPVP